MINQAKQKLQDEMAANQQNKYVQYVGQYMLKHLEQNPGDANNILVEGKTIKGSLGAMRTEAEKNKVDGVGMLTDVEGFAVVLKYYEAEEAQPLTRPIEMPPTPPIQPEPTGFDVSLEDLLKG